MPTSLLDHSNMKLKIEYNTNNALLTGNAGLYLYELLTNRISEDGLSKAEMILGSKFTNHTFCNGKAGVNWLFTYLYKNFGFIDLDTLDAIRNDDEYLKKISINNLEHGNYDFLHGALGVSYYLLYDTSTIDLEYHKKIIAILKSQFERDKNFLYRDSSDKNPELRKISLGLSHGLPSIIRYLAECVKHSIEKKTSIELCRKLIHLLKTYQNQDVSSGYYPTMIHLDEAIQDGSSRLAWCYGDPGVAIALYNTATIINEPDLKSHSMKVMLNTLSKTTPDAAMILDSCICHGTYGLAHIYNRMWNMTKDIRFLNAAEHWIKIGQSFALVEDNELEYRKYNALEKKWNKNHSLLEGNAGVGLALYSMETNDFSWDYCLMLND